MVSTWCLTRLSKAWVGISDSSGGTRSGPVSYCTEAAFSGLYFLCGGAGDDENFDLLPPAANGPPEPGRLGLVGFLHQPLEFFFGQLGVFQGAGAQQCSHLFFHVPGSFEGSPRFVVNSIVVMDDSPLFGRRF